jgi:hypothetical protein
MNLKVQDDTNFIEIYDFDDDKIMIALFENDSDTEIGNVIFEKNHAKQIISFLQNHFNL